MNRLAPLTRRPAIAAAVALETRSESAIPGAFDDLKFFATVWACGLVFFGTLFA